jgi:hypothetical protein
MADTSCVAVAAARSPVGRKGVTVPAGRQAKRQNVFFDRRPGLAM